MAAGAVTKRIADYDPAAPVPFGVCIAMLELLKSLGIPLLENCIVRVDVKIVDVAGAVAVRRNWKQKGRAEQIRDLESGMIFAVTENGHFYNARAWITGCAEFLSKEAERNAAILPVMTGICDKDSDVVLSEKKIIERMLWAE